MKQVDVDSGRIAADDLHGNGQADALANQGTEAHGPTEPDATWTHWADFANKLRERPEDEPQVRLPAEVAEETPVVVPTKGMVYLEAPLLGPHLRVVRHEAFLHCLDCGRQTGKVKGE
eukprot:2301005-Amphidinium_carterae.3